MTSLSRMAEREREKKEQLGEWGKPLAFDAGPSVCTHRHTRRVQLLTVVVPPSSLLNSVCIQYVERERERALEFFFSYFQIQWVRFFFSYVSGLMFRQVLFITRFIITTLFLAKNFFSLLSSGVPKKVCGCYSRAVFVLCVWLVFV